MNPWETTYLIFLINETYKRCYFTNYILTIYINWLFNVWSKNKKGRSWQTTCPDLLLNGFESQAVWQAPHKHPWWTTYLHFKGTRLSRLVFTYVKQQAHKHRHFKRISRSIPDNFWLQNHTDFWDINQKYLFWNSLYKVCGLFTTTLFPTW